MFDDNKADTTRIMVQKVALEAYAQWTMDTKNLCPGSLSELDKYRNSRTVKDCWDNPLIMLCGKYSPGKTSFAVFSMGEDGKPGTGDDIKSWE